MAAARDGMLLTLEDVLNFTAKTGSQVRLVSREVRHHLSLEFREIPEESIGANHALDETAQIRSLVLRASPEHRSGYPRGTRAATLRSHYPPSTNPYDR